MENDIEAAELSRLVNWFESAESQTAASRQAQDRCVDYYDGKQLTAAEREELKKRGQPAVVVNLIKNDIDYLAGVEKGQRVDPKAYPRTPNDEAAAYAATQVLRYVCDDVSYDTHRSELWKSLLKPGVAAIKVIAKNDKMGMTPDVEVLSYDRVFYDAASSKPNFSDARFMGTVTWMDYDVAVETYGEEYTGIFEATVASEGGNQHYGDKPKHAVWGDAKRRRVRICEIWYKKSGVWFESVFTKGGVISNDQSPYIDEDGQPECPLILQSAYVDRDNNRYGVIQEMLDLQDDYNKRRSKATHILNSRQVVADKGAVDDVAASRNDLSKPDAWIEKNPGLEIEINNNRGLEQGQFQLMQEGAAQLSKNSMKTAMVGGNDQSGRSKQIQQQAAFIEMGDLLDYLRDVDTRVFKMMWNRVKQFWQAPRYIRITDNTDTPKMLGLNMPVVNEYGQQVNVQNPVAQMDVDLRIEDAPDVTSLQGEAFESWTTSIAPMLLQAGIPPIAIAKTTIELMPHNAAKESAKRHLEEIEAQMQQPQQPNPLEEIAVADAAANVDKTQAETRKIESEVVRNIADARSKVPERIPVPVPVPVPANQRF